jgi:hypothetical protein
MSRAQLCSRITSWLQVCQASEYWCRYTDWNDVSRDVQSCAADHQRRHVQRCSIRGRRWPRQQKQGRAVLGRGHGLDGLRNRRFPDSIAAHHDGSSLLKGAFAGRHPTRNVNGEETTAIAIAQSLSGHVRHHLPYFRPVIAAGPSHLKGSNLRTRRGDSVGLLPGLLRIFWTTSSGSSEYRKGRGRPEAVCPGTDPEPRRDECEYHLGGHALECVPRRRRAAGGSRTDPSSSRRSRTRVRPLRASWQVQAQSPGTPCSCGRSQG